MRRLLRTTPLFLAAAMVVLAPAISPGQVVNKGPFNIDPTSAEPDTDFTLSFSNGSRCFQFPDPDEEQLDPVGDRVHIQVVGPRPANTVQDSTSVTPVGYGEDDPAGSWSGTLDLNLPEGTYLVTAECIHVFNILSSGSEPEFVLLGNNNEVPEEDRCTVVAPVEPPFNLGPGCYEPQELVIAEEIEEADPPSPRRVRPTLAG